MVVGPPLQPREHRLVDGLLQILAEEDHACRFTQAPPYIPVQWQPRHCSVVEWELAQHWYCLFCSCYDSRRFRCSGYTTLCCSVCVCVKSQLPPPHQLASKPPLLPCSPPLAAITQLIYVTMLQSHNNVHLRCRPANGMPGTVPNHASL